MDEAAGLADPAYLIIGAAAAAAAAASSRIAPPCPATDSRAAASSGSHEAAASLAASGIALAALAATCYRSYAAASGIASCAPLIAAKERTRGVATQVQARSLQASSARGAKEGDHSIEH